MIESFNLHSVKLNAVTIPLILGTFLPPQGKLPARITVPLSVLSQPLKSKSVVTTPILKGNISTK